MKDHSGDTHRLVPLEGEGGWTELARSHFITSEKGVIGAKNGDSPGYEMGSSKIEKQERTVQIARARKNNPFVYVLLFACGILLLLVYYRYRHCRER